MRAISTYRCDCGKEFSTPNAFGGHKSHCRIYLGDEKYFADLEHCRKASKIAKEKIHAKSIEFHQNKKKELQSWLKEEHTCEHCGKVMTEYYGSGRFCSKSCANTRQHSENSKAKISKKIKNRVRTNIDKTLYCDEFKDKIIDIRPKYRMYYLKEAIKDVDYIICPYCKARFGEIQQKHLKTHGKTLQDLKNEFGENYKLYSDKTYSKKQEAGEKSAQKIIEEGRHKGWQSRNVTSYAEKFWIKVLENNNIPYIREYVVKKSSLGLNDSSNYFLDFLLPGNIDLEIDGKQHKYSERKKHDIERDKILTKNGYIIYRIPWINPSHDKEQVQKQINDFLYWYKSLN